MRIGRGTVRLAFVIGMRNWERGGNCAAATKYINHVSMQSMPLTARLSTDMLTCSSPRPRLRTYKIIKDLPGRKNMYDLARVAISE